MQIFPIMENDQHGVFAFGCRIDHLWNEKAWHEIRQISDGLGSMVGAWKDLPVLAATQQN